jgi:hypothetical protein
VAAPAAPAASRAAGVASRTWTSCREVTETAGMGGGGTVVNSSGWEAQTKVPPPYPRFTSR